MRVVTATYLRSNEQPRVLLYIQDTFADKKSVIKPTPIESPLPYFYDEPQQHVDNYGIVKIDDVNVMNGTFKKYTVSSPEMIPLARTTTSRESDIPYTRRVIYDSNMYLGNDPLTKCYIDTEAYNPTSRFVDFEIDELKSISMILNDGRKYVIYNLRNESAQMSIEYSDDIENRTTYIKVANERSLLSMFYEITQNEAMYVGWNLRDFDYAFMKTRSMKYNMYDFNKHVWMDLMSLYKRFVTSYSKTNIVTSFSLENVSQHELGVGKLDKKEALWGNDIQKEMEYNLRDSELVKQIDEKTKLTELIDSMSITLNLLIDDCVYFSNAIEYVVMRELHNKYIFKNKQHIPPQKDSNYKGAFVQEAPTGIFKNVATFDFSSLYPNIIRTFNLGPETIYDSGEINIPELPYHYTKQFESVYNKIITQLLSLRKKYKQEYEQTHNETFNTMQIGVKFLIASFYGVLGFENGRLYDKRVAESITTIGQHLIKIIGEKFGSIYGDTDSVMIPLGDDYSKETIVKIENEMNELISDELKQYNTMTNTLNIRFEKMFDKVYFYGKKKRYYGVVTLDEDFNKCNYVLARGLEIRRTDWCPLAIEYETNILKLILEDIKLATQYHHDFLINIRKQPPEKFIIRKSITKPISEYKTIPPHIKIANEHDYIGSKIGYIVTHYAKRRIVNVSRDIDKAKPSYKYYIDKQIDPLYDRLLKPLIGTQQKLMLSD